MEMHVSNRIARMAKRLSCLVALGLVVLAAPAAQATPVYSYSFTAANTALGSSPYATMTAQQGADGNNNHVTFIVSSSTGGFGDFAFATGNLISAQVSAFKIVSSTFSTSLSTGNQDGFGVFDINGGNGLNDAVTKATIVLDTGDATIAANLASGQYKNAQGDLFALHFGFGPLQNFSNTGFVAVTPEPSSMVLLGSGLALGLAGVRRRRRSPAA
jgi:hypothetical protein